MNFPCKAADHADDTGGAGLSMPVMLSKTYDALIAAGAPDDKARAAAEELADYENRLASIDNRLAAVEGKLSILIWAVGVNAAATIAILGVLLSH